MNPLLLILIPSVPCAIYVSLCRWLQNTPEGWQDKSGFHLGKEYQAKLKRKLWRNIRREMKRK